MTTVLSVTDFGILQAEFVVILWRTDGKAGKDRLSNSAIHDTIKEAILNWLPRIIGRQ
jgi:hypothetical protein